MIDAFTSISEAWVHWFAPMLWQVSVLFMLVLAIDLLFHRRMWPRMRHALWLLVFIKLVIPPQFALPTGVFQEIGPATSAIWADATVPAEQETAVDSERMDQPADTTVATAAIKDLQESGAGVHWPSILFVCWLVGMFVIGTLAWLNILKLRRWHDEQLKRQAIPEWFNAMLHEAAEALGLETLPAVVFSDRIFTPAVYGLLKPVLLLPRAFAEDVPRDELRYMVYHELAHIKRKDHWSHSVVMFLQTVYWFNPLLLLANRRLKHVREICCDLTVAEALKHQKGEYRRTLINTARRLLTESVSPAMGLLGVFEEPYQIINRIKWLEKDMPLNKFFITLSSVFIVTIFLLFVLPMSPGSSASFADEPAITGFGAGTLPAKPDQTLTGDSYFYARQETSSKDLLLGFIVDRTLHSVDETWFNNTRAVLKEEGRRLIVDLEANTITFVNDVKEEYFTSQIPVDHTNVYADEAKDYFRDRKVNGEVAGTGKTRTILGLKCENYLFTRWELRGGSRVNTQTLNIWVTRDTPFRTDAFDIALDQRRGLQGAMQSARDEMKKAYGFQMFIDFNPDRDLFGRHRTSTTNEVSVVTNPKGIFDIPEHFTRKETLTFSDL